MKTSNRRFGHHNNISDLISKILIDFEEIDLLANHFKVEGLISKKDILRIALNS